MVTMADQHDRPTTVTAQVPTTTTALDADQQQLSSQSLPPLSIQNIEEQP